MNVIVASADFLGFWYLHRSAPSLSKNFPSRPFIILKNNEGPQHTDAAVSKF